MTRTVKKGLFFFYISLIVHAYFIFILGRMVDPQILEMLAHPERFARQETSIENIIVETVTQSPETPLKGKISDKPNTGAAPVTGPEENYNLYNPVMKEKQGRPGEESEQKTEQNSLEEKSDGVIPVAPPQKAAETGGNPATSFYDPERPVDVVMNSAGQISLATVPAEYADYFLDMQKKISAKWRDFFPVFQYYSGLIKSGQVQVDFDINNDGDVINPRVSESYGYRILDESSLNAVRYAENFGPLPEALRGQNGIRIHFRFIYMNK